MDYIDIIMPASNCAKYIGQAIESVKRQSYKNWKLIIIEDKSEDNTKDEIKKYIKDIEEKVTFIELEKHLGVSLCRNTGINKFNNRYIAFLDADDIWKEDKLEKQMSFMKDKKYVFTYTRYEYLKKGQAKEVKVMPKSLNYKEALKNTYILTSTVMLDTNAINKEQILMPQIESEDTATWWKILKNGFVAYGLNENLTTYRITKNGLSNNKIINLKRTWNIYRKQEKLSICKTLYNYINYIINAIIKRII